MKNNKIFNLLFLLAFIVSILLTSGCVSQNTQVGIAAQANPQKTRVIMLDIGQGDSIIIQAHGKNILVDASKIDTRAQLIAKLEHYQVKNLELVIATHAHEDHIGGFNEVFNKIPVKEVLDAGVPSTSKLYHNFLLKIKEKKIKFTVPQAGNKIELGPGTYLEFFTPLDKPATKDNINNTSLVFKLVDNNFSMLFTGDIEKNVEKLLVQKYPDSLRSDILKSPHHGSSTSSSQQFLNKINASAVLVSCAVDNEYKHPHEVVTNRYKKNNIRMYVTHQTGDIAVVGVDNSYLISTAK